MTLSAGTRLGSYEIVAPLGAGGMGEVYRARDTRLGRDVAIKALPEALAADRDRLSRFEQEARSASALNHPNIVTIYEVGAEGAVSYIAMELVQGKTLRELLAEGPLPQKRLLAIGSQIADGLARAHEAGIVHRDLKPENLMVTREGLVKILDFGLAKLALPDSGGVSAMPTLAKPETHPGVVLGTVGYMSPEQASGKALDYRSDQFAVGSILYEMATGRRAFSRPTTAETLAAIIREEPEPLPKSDRISTAVRWTIERCLAKDPGDRYAATRDLARDLAHLRDHLSEIVSEPAPVALARRLGWLGPALVAGVFLAGILAVFAVLRTHRTPPGRAMRFTVEIPPGTIYAPYEISRGFSVSPDGMRIVIEVIAKGHRRLYSRLLESEEAVELEGSENAVAHFWSPDSRFIAFFADGKLKKIPAAGGPAQELCNAPLAMVGSWGQDGSILFSRLDPPGIYRVSDAGGEVTRVAAPDPSRHQVTCILPHFLPGDRRFLYIAGKEPSELMVASLDGRENRALGHTDSGVQYVPPGSLFFVRRDGSLFVQPFDAQTVRFEGEARRLAANTHFFFGPSYAPFCVSQTGVVTYQAAPRFSQLVWVTREGKEVDRLGDAAVIRGLRISPDGGRAAVDIRNAQVGSSDIWVFDLGRGVSTRLHSDPMDEVLPLWSADGSKLFYRSDRKGPPDIYEIAVDVPGSEKLVLELPGVQQPEDASRDGRVIAYLNEVATTMFNIELLPLDGQSKPRRWLPGPFNQTSPRFSPDGRWIAYESEESGDSEVYLALTDGGAQKRRLSPGGGRLPRWRRDGRELYYIAPGNLVMAVSVTPGPVWQAGEPKPLFRLGEEIQNYDVAPDGSRFLVKRPAEKSQASLLHVIVNWPALAAEK
jgi:Tol biopolymer transport system component